MSAPTDERDRLASDGERLAHIREAAPRIHTLPGSGFTSWEIYPEDDGWHVEVGDTEKVVSSFDAAIDAAREGEKS